MTRTIFSSRLPRSAGTSSSRAPMSDWGAQLRAWLQNDLFRGGVAIGLLGLLWLIGLPLLLVLVLPIGAYVALRLIAPSEEPAAMASGGDRQVSRDEREASELIQKTRAELDVLASQLPDPVIAEQVRSVMEWIERCNAVIDEDGSDEDRTRLSHLIVITNELLRSYAKVIRRGLGGDATSERIRANLAALEVEYQLILDQLNKYAMVDLEALSDTISTLMRDSRVPANSADLDEPTFVIEPEVPGLTPPSEALPALAPVEIPELVLASIGTLTVREREVIPFVVDGKTNREIADLIFVSPRTVAKHIENIFSKLGVSNRAELTAFAVRYGLA